jgi:hypothetical protein
VAYDQRWILTYCNSVMVWHGDTTLTFCTLLEFAHSIPTTWSRILLEKLTVTQLVKIFPALYGIRNFITVFAIARH